MTTACFAGVMCDSVRTAPPFTGTVVGLEGRGTRSTGLGAARFVASLQFTGIATRK